MLSSFDTNILFYSINKDCDEHVAAKSLIYTALKQPHNWIVADQLWFELYRLLRNTKLLVSPLSAYEAWNVLHWYREQSGWLSCAWSIDMMKSLETIWKTKDFAARKVFDQVLGLTLINHGVTHFYTRNTTDFETLGFQHLINPIDK